MSNELEQPLCSYRWVIIAVVWLTQFMGMFAQFQLAPLAYLIIPALEISPGQFAMILTSPMLAGIIFSIPGGMLGDRFGVKVVVSIAFLFSFLGTFLRFAAGSFWPMFGMMFFTGFAVSLLTANISKLIGTWFPGKHMGVGMGIYSSATGSGMAVALAVSALFPTLRMAYMISGVMMLVAWILWVVLIREIKPTGARNTPMLPAVHYLKHAAKNKNVWLMGLALMFFMACNVTLPGFLPTALSVAKGLSPVDAGLMASVLMIATIVGAIFGPLIAGRLGKFKPYLVITSLMGSISIYIVWSTPLGLINWIFLIISGLMLGTITPIMLSFPFLIPEIGPVYAGSAGGIVSSIMVIGGFVFPSFIFAPLAGSNFTLLFGLCSISLILLAFITLFISEVGDKARNKSTEENEK